MILETDRLFLREMNENDVHDLFEMDADPQVHLYIENKPLKTIHEAEKIIQLLQNQYKENGIARWAVVLKSNNECIGWCGLKYYSEILNKRSNFYELGYRFKQSHWGKGYATESSKAVISYAKRNLSTSSIFALTHLENKKSIHVLEKLGFTFIENFDFDGDLCKWFELKL